MGVFGESANGKRGAALGAAFRAGQTHGEARTRFCFLLNDRDGGGVGVGWGAASVIATTSI